jgi:MFS family permease
MSNLSDSTESNPPTDSSSPVVSDAPKAVPPAPAAVWLWAAALGGALVAGLLAWEIGEKTYNYYQPSPESRRSRYDFSRLNREQAVADRKNAAIAYGTFGALLGMFLGASGGIPRRSIASVLSAAAAGLLLGVLGGALAAYVLTPFFSQFYSDRDPSLLLPVLLRGGTFAVIGILVGLTFGLARGGLADAMRSATGGLLGGLLGIIVFEAANAHFFPMERNDNMIPNAMLTRLICYLSVAVCLALGTLILGREPRHSRVKRAGVDP